MPKPQMLALFIGESPTPDAVRVKEVNGQAYWVRAVAMEDPSVFPPYPDDLSAASTYLVESLDRAAELRRPGETLLNTYLGGQTEEAMPGTYGYDISHEDRVPGDPKYQVGT